MRFSYITCRINKSPAKPTGLRSKRLVIKIFCTIWMTFSLGQKLIARNVNSHYKLLSKEKLSWSKSDGETLSNRNALLMSVFANFPLLPILLIMSMASSMPEYLTVQKSGSMKSLTEYWVGYERLWISRKSPCFFLTRKIRDTLKVGIGG
jgi:flagellar biosynthesis protein FlhB